MVLRFGTKVLEYALFPETFHKVPVLNNTVTYRIHGGIAGLISFISDIEI